MKFAKKQIFFLSLLLSFCMLAAPFTEQVYAEGLFSKLKEKASNFISNTIEKYTSRDYWVDKTASAISTKIVAKPVKLATAALGMAIGTAIGGPVGATLGAYIGNKVASHACDIIATPVVKNVINDKLDNGGSITVKSIYNAAKNLDMPSLACDTTGAVVGDILGGVIGGVAGAAIMACVGGGTILPIIGTMTFATLGSKYGEKFGNWLGQKLGENAYNSTYKAITGVERSDKSSNAIVATINDVKSVNKEEVARNTTGEVVGDVIGSALGTVAGATLSAFTTGGTSSKMAELGEKWGSNLGSKIGNWIGTTFFDKSKEAVDKTANAVHANLNNANNGVTVTISNEIPVACAATVAGASSKKDIKQISSDADAAFAAYQIAYDNYAKALADKNCSKEHQQKMMEQYHACYNAYQRIVTGK